MHKGQIKTTTRNLTKNWVIAGLEPITNIVIFRPALVNFFAHELIANIGGERRAKELLAFTQQRIAEVAKSVGFTDPYYFSRLFQDKEGIVPTLFRAQQRLPPNDG